METLVLVMMLLVCFTFILKQTFHGISEVMVISVVLAAFIGFSWPLAIEQSKTQIEAWIADQQLMLDMAVLLSIDVSLTMLFCIYLVDLQTTEHFSRRKWMFYQFMKYFPGLLIFPVLFALLVALIFMLPGMSFEVISWGLAAVVLILVPCLTLGLRWLLPERPIRLEMLFLLVVLLGLMGIVGTVNGRTAVTGINDVNLMALLFVAGIVFAGILVGSLYYKVRAAKNYERVND